MLSVPLVWNDRIVGVLNVQTEQTRDFTSSDVAHLRVIADLLAGIVEKGRIQKEAEARATELKAIDEARAELIAMVTHELRTPLAVVRAYTELLAEEPPLGGRESRDTERRDRRAGWYRSTMDQVARLDRLVDSILASVRVDSEPAADLIPTDVGLVVGEAATELAPLLARHRLELKTGIRLFALTDPSRLRQILEHLVENAVKYAPPDTTIRLDWQMADGSVRIGVADEGPASPRNGASGSSSRTPGATRTPARGSGIGLYAARRLADSVGARLWCEPAKGHGARFVIALPAAAAV